MPDKSVASKRLVVADGEVGVLISRGKGVLAAPRLDRLPLHGILGSDGTKLQRALDDVLGAGVLAESEGGAYVLLSFGLDCTIKTSRAVGTTC